MEFGIFIVIMVIIIIVGFFNYLSEEGQKESWRHFAAAHSLNFVRGSWLGQRSHVSGKYRNRWLMLETFSKKEGRQSHTYTRLQLSWGDKISNRVLLEDHPVGKQWTSNEIVSVLSPQNFNALKGEVQFDRKSWSLVYEQRGLETRQRKLEGLADLLSNVADNYPKILALGSEVMPALYVTVRDKYHPLRPVVLQLMQDIANKTTHQLGLRAATLFCPHCFTLCAKHEVSLGWWQSLTYYGCRTCHQSREYLTGRPVAVLDHQMNKTISQQEGLILINWLTHRHPFDFDGVCIVRATDEEVERFAVQCGNDTDPIRRARYAQMRCVIAPDCNLSQNTHRILDRMFGKVTVETTLQTEVDLVSEGISEPTVLDLELINDGRRLASEL